MASKDCRLGLPPVANNDSPGQERRSSLGERLFKDRKLSQNGAISCSSCHDPGRAFSDGRAEARGVGDQAGTRNTPSLINIGYAPVMSWDGRRVALGEQALAPLTNAREHGLMNMEEVLRRLRVNKIYSKLFEYAFPGEKPAVSEAHLRTALVAYLNSLKAGGSVFDRYYYGKDARALDIKAWEGLKLFTGRAKCSECHKIEADGTLLTDYQFHRIGIGMPRINPRLAELTQAARALTGADLERKIFSDPDIAALGRFLATGKPTDIGRFRTPSLRNVALTSPYMHDGSIATLPEAVEAELYYRGLESGKPIALTPLEKQFLVHFLKSLTGCMP